MFQTGATGTFSLRDLQSATSTPLPPGGESPTTSGFPRTSLGIPRSPTRSEGGTGLRAQVPPRNSEASGSLLASLESLLPGKAASWISRRCVCLAFQKSILEVKGTTSYFALGHGSDSWRPILATQLLMSHTFQIILSADVSLAPNAV